MQYIPMVPVDLIDSMLCDPLKPIG